MSRTILITGVTGNQGGAVAQAHFHSWKRAGRTRSVNPVTRRGTIVLRVKQ